MNPSVLEFFLVPVALLGAALLVGVFFIVRSSRRSGQPAPRPSLGQPVSAAGKAPKECPRCHRPYTADAPEGLCPECLGAAALETETTVHGPTGQINPVAGAAPHLRVPPEPADLAAHFPQLEILELLGMGGMGMVYKARQPRLDRIVALKILPLDSPQHPSFAERFGREAKALAKLNHPGIVAVYDFGRNDRYFYFIMEYVDGVNLRQLLKTRGVAPRQALELVTQICAALQFAHDEGVVHRDIKPENILMNKKGQVKIADFGLVKLLGDPRDTALTMSQATMGTFNYMAPEQRENAQAVDHRADIYSLGVVFYEMLTGELPIGRFAAPSQKVQVDVRLDEVVLKSLEKEPDRRYQHASEVKTRVEDLQTKGSVPPAKKAAKFKENMKKLVAVVLIVAGGALILMPLLEVHWQKERVAEFYAKNGNAADLPHEMDPEVGYGWACFFVGVGMVFAGARQSLLPEPALQPTKAG